MISSADADMAFRQSRDLGDSARILRERFPNSTSDDRIEAIRDAQKRVFQKHFNKNRRRKPRLEALDAMDGVRWPDDAEARRKPHGR